MQIVDAGTATLSGGTVVVNSAAVTASSIIVFTRHSALGTIGDLRITSRAAGTFTLGSLNVLDNSSVSWIVVG